MKQVEINVKQGLNKLLKDSKYENFFMVELAIKISNQTTESIPEQFFSRFNLAEKR